MFLYKDWLILKIRWRKILIEESCWDIVDPVDLCDFEWTSLNIDDVNKACKVNLFILFGLDEMNLTASQKAFFVLLLNEQ